MITRIQHPGVLQIALSNRMSRAVGYSVSSYVTRGQLVNQVRTLQAERPDLAVVIAADRNLRYEEVVRVMDALQQSKIRRVGLLVKPADK